MHVRPDDAALTEIYARRGPFVSVYLDLTRGDDPGIDAVDERWSRVRDGLLDADPDTVDAIEESLTVDPGDTSEHGIAAIAADGELCLAERLDAPPANAGSAGAVPDVLPYLVGRTPVLPHLIVALSGGGARLMQLRGGRLVALGDRQPVPAVTDDQIAVLVRLASRQAARHDPQIVAVVGDPELTGPIAQTVERRLVTEVETRLADGGDRSVFGAALDVLRQREAGDDVELTAGLREFSGDRRRVATGARDVLAALRTAQADVVVVNAGSELDRGCWVGPRPTELWLRVEEARAAGVAEPLPGGVGAAVVRAAFATGSTLVVADSVGLSVPQGMAALLH